MREIKFRAWDKINKRWIDLYAIKLSANGNIIGVEDIDGEIYGLHQVELIEYTGLKDKNGREIYEGDILQLIRKSENPCWEVVWFENGWHMKLIKKKPEHPKSYHVRLSSERVLEFDEVIGNIYENPDRGS